MRTQVIRGKAKDISIPDGMSYDQAIQHINSKKEEESYGERDVLIQEVIRRFPFEAVHALTKAITEIYGTMLQFDRQVPGGVVEASMISVPISVKEYVLVPWGSFTLPGIEGYLDTRIHVEGGSICLSVNAKVKRKYESQIKSLVERARQIAIEESIYQGQAISVLFNTDEDGDSTASAPTFLRMTSSLDPIFSQAIQEEIERSIIVPLREAERAKAIGLEFKRAVLLRGEYGSGKSLTANYIGRLAVALERTFIYVPHPRDYAEALRLAVDYQPAMLFVDDLDRVAQGLRTNEMDDLLVRIDGVETKDADIFLIATTNNIDMIHPAFLRPGRTDVIIKVDEVDAETAERLLRRFGRPVIAPSEDLSSLAQQLAGKTPAYIREVVDRAKWELLRTSKTEKKPALTADILKKMLALVAGERVGIDASSTETQLKKSRANGHADYHA